MIVTLTIAYIAKPVSHYSEYPNAIEARRELLRVLESGDYRMIGSGNGGVLAQGVGADRKAIATYAIALRDY